MIRKELGQDCFFVPHRNDAPFIKHRHRDEGSDLTFQQKL
jgi:hypothetical protein